jgi:hypothetical protein
MRVFDFDDNKLKLDMAELVVQRPVSRPSDFGFRFDATVGQSVPKVAASYGLFRDRSTGEAHDYDLHQVFISWIMPVGHGIRLDLGKFATPFGYEVIEGYDGYNDNQTRSFLFGYAIPFTHTGLRASYTFTAKLWASAMVVNGWDNWYDNNDAKSLGIQLAVTPTKTWTFYVTAMGGPEQDNNSHNDRYNFNFVSVYKPRDPLTLGLDVVVGNEAGLPAPGAIARWRGVAGYLRRRFTDPLALTLRAEIFDDADGARTGTAQTLKEVTLTPEYKLGKHIVLRGDLRCDWSDQDAFQKRSDFADNQTTASVAVLFVH